MNVLENVHWTFQRFRTNTIQQNMILKFSAT